MLVQFKMSHQNCLQMMMQKPILAYLPVTQPLIWQAQQIQFKKRWKALPILQKPQTMIMGLFHLPMACQKTQIQASKHSTKDFMQTTTDDKQTEPSKPGQKEPPKEFEDQNPDAHKGVKHLHRTEHELNQTATETEDEESEQEEIHDTPTRSFHGTPERSTTGSKDEDYLEPENVEVVEPKGTRKSWRKQKVEEKTDSGNISENSDTPISQLKKV